jgi:hypothetical protein
MTLAENYGLTSVNLFNTEPLIRSFPDRLTHFTFDHAMPTHH